MNIRKYQHACFTVEKDGQSLVIDPGNFTRDFIVPANVIGVVITHEHGDHLDPDLLAAIYDKNPDVIMAGPAPAIAKIKSGTTFCAKPGDSLSIGAFRLAFFGGGHALIHQSMPLIENVGVMIDGLVYYPGDSLDVPKQPVDTLALPAAAPWMKIGEALDYLVAVRPRLAFPTHDAILSEEGRRMTDQMLSRVADDNGITYQRLGRLPYAV